MMHKYGKIWMLARISETLAHRAKVSLSLIMSGKKRVHIWNLWNFFQIPRVMPKYGNFKNVAILNSLPVERKWVQFRPIQVETGSIYATSRSFLEFQVSSLNMEILKNSLYLEKQCLEQAKLRPISKANFRAEIRVEIEYMCNFWSSCQWPSFSCLNIVISKIGLYLRNCFPKLNFSPWGRKTLYMYVAHVELLTGGRFHANKYGNNKYWPVPRL